MKKSKMIKPLLSALTAGMMLCTSGVLSAAAEESFSGEAYDSGADIISFNSALAAYNSVAVKSGKYANWIDRISVPTYAKNFYDKLVEGSDGDKTDDFLIDYTKAEDLGNGTYGLLISSKSDTVSSESAMNTAVEKEYSAVMENASAVFTAFDHDHPEVFWLDGTFATSYSNSYSYNSSRTSFSYTMKIFYIVRSPSYSAFISDYNTSTKIYSGITKLNTTVNSIMSGAPTDTVKAITYFNDTLTKKNEYNTRSDLSTAPAVSHRSISALTGSTGVNGPVCEGYSRAFKVLCNKAGIPCFLVSGVANGGGHMWNAAQVDGSWYYMDVTWNDPVLEGASGAVSGAERNDYTLVGSTSVVCGEKFSNSHTVNNGDGRLFMNQPDISAVKYTAPDYTPGKVTAQTKFSAVETAVRINWNKVSNASGYRVYRYNSSTGKWASVATVTSGDTLTYRQSGLTAGTVYKYKVRAYRKVNGKTYWGDFSDTITTATRPVAPTVTRVGRGRYSVRPYWNKVKGASGYKIQQYVSGSWKTVKAVSSSTTNYAITSLKKNTAYKFRIQAYTKISGVTLYSSWTNISTRTTT
ncbi:MAG: transglutaminase domain-containing protein [Oscillospiraceae bacterium]